MRRDVLVALVLGAAALAARLFVLAGSPFDGLYGQDAYAYFAQAQAMRSTLATGAPLPPFFWPLGYPLLLAGIFSVFGETAAAGQALSLLMGAALAPLVYALARMADVNRPGAAFAGLLMAANGQAIQSSLVLMADIPAVLWASLSAGLLLLGLRRAHGHWFALAGLALGAAAVTRWVYLLLWLPFAAAFVAGRGRWRGTLFGGAVFALVALPQLLISAASPFPTLNHAWVQGWSPANAFTQDFVNVDGAFHYAQINAVFYAAPAYDAHFLGPLAVPLIAFGVLALRGAPRLLMAGWALVGWLFLAGIPYQNIRFGLTLSPPLAVLAGAGFGWLWVQADRRRGWRAALAGVGATGLVWMLATGVPRVSDFIAAQQADKDAVAWAAAQIPAGATIYTSGLTLALRLATDGNVVELYGWEPADLRATIHVGDFVLVNRWQIDHQWAGTPLQTTIVELERGRGLSPVGRTGYYTLYEVRR